MTILKATQDHLDQIIEISQIWDEEEDNVTRPEKLQSHIDEEMVYIYIDDEGDDTISGVMIIEENYDYLNLQTLYVHPDYRGEGIGSKMMDKLIDMLDKSAMSAFLEVDAHNQAIDLYEKYGFNESPEHDTIQGHIAMTREPG